IARRLAERRQALQDERGQLERLLAQRQRAYANRLAALRSQQAQVDSDIATMKSRVGLSERNVAINREMRSQGYISEQRMQLGGHANISTPLLSIVPAGTKLEAHLYSPSRAVGFVRAGQHVLLRYQAYPYQKFGHYEGTVSSVSRSAVSPAELPPQLAGMSSLIGISGPNGSPAAEPVYLITVTLDRHAVTGYRKQVPS